MIRRFIRILIRTLHIIKQYLDEQDLDWDEDVAEDIMDRVKHIGRHYKNHFNRPRPYQIAEKLGEIDDMEKQQQ